MQLLLDTHVLIWAATSPEKFGKKAKELLQDKRNSRYVSAISVFELAQLQHVGRLQFKEDIKLWLSKLQGLLHFDEVDVNCGIALAAYGLPGEFHRDPADRILVATARELELELLTADRRLLDYVNVRSFSVFT